MTDAGARIAQNVERVRSVRGFYRSLLGRGRRDFPVLPGEPPPIMNIGYWTGGATEARQAQIALVHELASRLPPLRGKRVLDAGCGVAGPAAILAQEYGADVDGVNISEQQVALAREYLAANGLDGRVRVQLGNAMDLSFRDESFDAVFSLEAAHCFVDKPRFLAEARRVLRPGGALVLADITATSHLPVLRRQPLTRLDLVTEGDWRELVEAAGLELRSCERIGRSVYPGYRRWLRRTAGSRRSRIAEQLLPNAGSLPGRWIRSGLAWPLELALCRTVLPLGSLLGLRDYVLLVARRPETEKAPSAAAARGGGP